ncbi:methylenetetrahydrofolate reductase C-terminal domain-containing protein [Pelagicoccus sp. SDUM812005]|uniref:methylenetetrahydrofolate reductase C-terminal domain-containing protein n=1 Tax=Pelagicoccus sp. SDUM812005 TaxID=3041257 RepID=UPI00280C8B7B|nr:methylenetetrahydrofolate reductase C-terminal domain-containing protein [Pelagicoccus sp. SDUM812005]MDQ8183672.1 methylenetetrahydrofolate reductase C-terminal domain-containing protein [Pelagicoccus sp. SDUM812005]
MIYTVEKWIKEKAFGCQTCGQCILTHTKLICPMNCPKGLRNGPCGGTLDGKCEVIPEIECVWTRIEKKKTQKQDGIHLPPDPKLLNTASYVNFVNGKDRKTRLPQDFVDTSEIPASSRLARKMYRGEFVVTLEIASPLTAKGLNRVDKIMERVADHVDAVNTTTNAGGIPSLSSMETAEVVQAYQVESIIQFCGRDHHADDFLRELEKAIGSGHKNFLLLTGDWLPQKDRKVDQQSWFPMDSSQMIHFANTRLEDFQQRLGVAPYLGCAANPFSTPMPISVERLHFKRQAGARFCQTQAITHVPTFQEWYKQLRAGRENEPKLTIPSIPLVGSRRAFEVLCRLPGVYVDESLRRIMESEDFQRKALDWAFEIAEGVTEHGAAGVHTMNFGMPPHLIDEFLLQIRDRARQARLRSLNTVT